MMEFYFRANGQRFKAQAEDKRTCNLAAIEFFREPTVIIYDDNEVIYAFDETTKDQITGCDYKKYLRDFEPAIQACMKSIELVRENSKEEQAWPIE